MAVHALYIQNAATLSNAVAVTFRQTLKLIQYGAIMTAGNTLPARA